MRASIIIVCFGQRAVTEACLESLGSALGDRIGDEWELVLVDNASPDDTLDLLHEWRDRATVVALESNRDFAGGCNVGAAAATGEVLVFLNNDTIVAPGTLELLVEQASEPDVGVTGPRLHYPDGTIQHAGVWMVREPGNLVTPYHLFLHEPGDLEASAIQADLDCVTGACLVMRASVFAELGGFDADYRNGWEDVDLCLRVRMQGLRIVYRGDVAFVHAEGATRSTVRFDGKNEARFRARWNRVLDDDLAAFGTIWDATYAPPVPESAELGFISVLGPVRGLGAAGAHTRAVIAALERMGRRPSAADPIEPVVEPRLNRSEWAAIRTAMSRSPAPGAAVVDALGVGTPVRPGALTAGGDLVLVVLPAHDLLAAQDVLAAGHDVGGPMLVLPTARTRQVELLVQRWAPAARLLPASSSETTLVALAERCDVVIAVDPADRWDRTALVCAGTGAAVVVREDGPAAEILDEFAGTLAAGPRAVEQRAARRDRVAIACADDTVLGPLLKTRELAPTTRP
jgi:GT2 family glycosyltransferase